MATLAPAIHYIEIIEKRNGEKVACVIGTQITVAEIATMYTLDSSIEWMIENFSGLSHANIHAALSYYYDHKAEIDAYLARQDARSGDYTLEKITTLKNRS